jgi:hypothetical protein
MESNQINQIEVKDFTVVVPSSEIEKAKKLLKDSGYFVDNLWRIEDVMVHYDCTKEQAQEVLNNSLQNEATLEQIWFAIHFEAGFRNLKRKGE